MILFIFYLHSAVIRNAFDFRVYNLYSIFGIRGRKKYQSVGEVNRTGSKASIILYHKCVKTNETILFIYKIYI